MRRSHKLLAVVMWVGSTQAQADPPRTPAPPSEAREVLIARSQLAVARQQLEQFTSQELQMVRQFIMTPRRLANGAPACGNTMGKGDPEPCTQAIADQEHANRLANMTVAIKLRRDARASVEELSRMLEVERSIAR